MTQHHESRRVRWHSLHHYKLVMNWVCSDRLLVMCDRSNECMSIDRWIRTYKLNDDDVSTLVRLWNDVDWSVTTAHVRHTYCLGSASLCYTTLQSQSVLHIDLSGILPTGCYYTVMLGRYSVQSISVGWDHYTSILFNVTQHSVCNQWVYLIHSRSGVE